MQTARDDTTFLTAQISNHSEELYLWKEGGRGRGGGNVREEREREILKCLLVTDKNKQTNKCERPVCRS